ncbi:MAG TPA: DUF1887 family CARF protein [Roseiflexaceae bacterium]|nr:DUF1887 family CARF protein [Roseiflexaceae bacterium]
MPNDRYRVDHLFLLIGTNPLPNYVAAKLLLRDPQSSQIVLVASVGTEGTRAALERTLKEEGYRYISSVQVEEANPADIRNKITEQARGLNGLVGLNYTGGTKAMSVHAYLALTALTNLHVQYSYLDARTLSLHIEGHGIETGVTLAAGPHVTPTVEQVLKLHSRETSLHSDLFWPIIAQALAEVHSDGQRADSWQAWIAETFFQDPNWPQPSNENEPLTGDEWRTWVRETFVHHEYKRRTWKKKSAVAQTPFNLPEALGDVREAFVRELCEPFPTTIRELMAAGRFDKVEELGKWLEGGWLETYVMQQVQAIQEQGIHRLNNVARNIHATVELANNEGATSKTEQAPLKQEVEIDVAFTRGYQLFVLSCSASKDRGLCKSKLLEAAIRAEQIGGAEARVALVCCNEQPRELEKEVLDVLGKRVRVFGRAHLAELKQHLADWITDVSPNQE